MLGAFTLPENRAMTLTREQQQDHLREAYRVMTEAQERHMAMMQAAIRGELYDPDKLMESAKEVMKRTAEFTAASEPLIRRGPVIHG
jgi:hypothetical protein